MVIPKEILTDFKEQYEKAHKLVNEDSKNDPPTDPFRSHYVARDILLRMKSDLKTALASVEADEAAEHREDDKDTFSLILAHINYDLGRLYIFTEEQSEGVKLLQECVSSLATDPYKPGRIVPYLSALVEMGMECANRSEFEVGSKMLIQVEEMYMAFKNKKIDALAITDLFGLPQEVEKGKGNSELEQLYTLCCFYLAQIYGQLGEAAKSAHYCHLTLGRQLTTKTYEPIDFSLSAATLSQYFVGENMFQAARYHLAVATKIMLEYKEDMIKPDMTAEEKAVVNETFNHRFADVSMCWAKYGLNLLISSKERLYNDDIEKVTQDVLNWRMDADAFKFPGVEVDDFEKRITADYCLTFSDVKPVFHFVTEKLDIAKAYYTPETEATEYSKIMRDYAELYNAIAFFEENPVNEIKMHKRRAKYYEDLLELLNPVFYMSICRECWFGAAIAYAAILDLRLDMVKNRDPTPQEVQKINATCQHAIKHHQDLVLSYMTANRVLKDNIAAADLRTIFVAYFNLGRLHFKMISPDLVQQLDYITKSYKYYKKFVDGCDANEEVAKDLKAELGVSREMVTLLPLRIESMKLRVANTVAKN